MAFPLFVPGILTKKIYKTRRTLEKLSDAEIRQCCGLPAWGVRELISLYEPLEGQIATSIPLDTKVLVFLSQLRSGSFQWMVGSSYGVSQASSSRIISACADQTLTFAKEVIDFPTTTPEINEVKQDFFGIGRIPNTIGILDGTHVPIIGPHLNEPAFVNRKQYHSINCQVIAGRNYKIFDIVAKWPGSVHDSFIWKDSSARRRLYSGEFGDCHLIGKLLIYLIIFEN